MNLDINNYFDGTKYDATIVGSIKDKRNKNCIEFSYSGRNNDEKELFISDLMKCAQPGSENLRNMINYANSFYPTISKLCLYDASSLNICPDRALQISLDILQILVKGETWYNSHGFRSNIFEEEKSHNMKIIRDTFKNVLDKIEINEFRLAYNSKYIFLNQNGETALNTNVNDITRKELLINIIMKMLVSVTGWTQEKIYESVVQDIFQEINKYLLKKDHSCDDEVYRRNIDSISVLIMLMGTLLKRSFLKQCLDLHGNESFAGDKRYRSENSLSAKMGGSKKQTKKRKQKRSKRKRTKTTRRRFY
jgi:hypothetical protein